MPAKRRSPISDDEPNGKAARTSDAAPLKSLTRRLTRRQLEVIVLQTAETHPQAEGSIRNLIEPMYKHANLFSRELDTVKETLENQTPDVQLVYDTPKSIVDTLQSELNRRPPSYDPWLIWRRAFDVLVQIGYLVESGGFRTTQIKFEEMGFLSSLNDKMIDMMNCLGETAEIDEMEDFKVLAHEVTRLEGLLAGREGKTTPLDEIVHEMGVAIIELDVPSDEEDDEEEEEGEREEDGAHAGTRGE